MIGYLNDNDAVLSVHRTQRTCVGMARSVVVSKHENRSIRTEFASSEVSRTTELVADDNRAPLARAIELEYRSVAYEARLAP